MMYMVSFQYSTVYMMYMHGLIPIQSSVYDVHGIIPIQSSVYDIHVHGLLHIQYSVYGIRCTCTWSYSKKQLTHDGKKNHFTFMMIRICSVYIVALKNMFPYHRCSMYALRYLPYFIITTYVQMVTHLHVLRNVTLHNYV